MDTFHCLALLCCIALKTMLFVSFTYGTKTIAVTCQRLFGLDWSFKHGVVKTKLRQNASLGRIGLLPADHAGVMICCLSLMSLGSFMQFMHQFACSSLRCWPYPLGSDTRIAGQSVICSCHDSCTRIWSQSQCRYEALYFQLLHRDCPCLSPHFFFSFSQLAKPGVYY